MSRKPYFVAESIDTRWGRSPIRILSEHDDLVEAQQAARWLYDQADLDIDVWYRSGTEVITCIW